MWSESVRDAENIAPYIAKVYKVFYDEFKSAGFSDSQAMTLIRDCVLEIFAQTEPKRDGDEWKDDTDE